VTRAAERAVRISPVTADEQTEQMAELLDRSRRGRDVNLNIYATLARNPTLFGHWLSLAHGLLFEGTLTGRDRELLVMRTAVNCDSDYEWAQHRKFAIAGGISPEEIAAVYSGWSAHPWEPKDRALLAAADELHRESAMSDKSWRELSQHFSTEQLIEITMVVGVYHLVAMLLNTCGVQLEPGLTGFPA
jgi:alkylhydroperoxidase family enzyme